jgi:metal-responsive CopG/Arc/MetJ family transcriptional regulator
MTPQSPAATNCGVGRKKLYPVRITLPITSDMLARLDAVRGQEERVAVIRSAVERELRRREQSKPRRKKR